MPAAELDPATEAFHHRAVPGHCELRHGRVEGSTPGGCTSRTRDWASEISSLGHKNQTALPQINTQGNHQYRFFAPGLATQKSRSWVKTVRMLDATSAEQSPIIPSNSFSQDPAAHIALYSRGLLALPTGIWPADRVLATPGPAVLGQIPLLVEGL